ncbi:uncharacterized protein LOC117647187 [Thrips palmi]|uniref:Uncharacterized protein LOC117647187 n=1 Tax=Thrips palmi TaxID=161013 RepID=A0A6P8YX30_THRPL|nr:uncharacterized protein LOC117647187 [Thrips palmi]
MLPLVLLLVACLLPPPRGGAAPSAPTAPAQQLAVLATTPQPPEAVSKSSAQGSAGLFRLSVDNHYTMTRKRPRAKQHELSPAALRADPALGGDVDTVTAKIGERIIRVPHRRVATGCRIYQRMDRLGQCRNRW